MSELASHDDLLKAVGGALSNWSLVEIQLSDLFEALSDIPDQRKSKALFASIINFEARLAVCDRLMELETLSELDVEMWAKLSARLSKFCKKRHELAHFSINYDASEHPTISPFLTPEKFAFDKVRHLTLEQVGERSRKFIDLHMVVGWFAQEAFWRRVKSQEGRPPKTEEPVLVPQLRELAIQSLEERRQHGRSKPRRPQSPLSADR